jgi:hypothetical protein
MELSRNESSRCLSGFSNSWKMRPAAARQRTVKPTAQHMTMLGIIITVCMVTIFHNLALLGNSEPPSASAASTKATFTQSSQGPAAPQPDSSEAPPAEEGPALVPETSEKTSTAATATSGSADADVRAADTQPLMESPVAAPAPAKPRLKPAAQVAPPRQVPPPQEPATALTPFPGRPQEFQSIAAQNASGGCVSNNVAMIPSCYGETDEDPTPCQGHGRAATAPVCVYVTYHERGHAVMLGALVLTSGSGSAFWV